MARNTPLLILLQLGVLSFVSPNVSAEATGDNIKQQIVLQPLPLQPAYSILPYDHPEAMASRTIQSGVVKGMARNRPLDAVLRQVVPGTFQIMYDADLDSKRPISFRGGRHWTEILEEIETNFSLVIKVTDRDVQVSTSDAIIITSNRDLKKFEVLPRGTGKPSETQVAINDRKTQALIYQAKAGDSVQELLNKWSEGTKWKVVWKSQYAYRIEVEREFKGDFVEIASKLIASYQTSRIPLHLRIYDNSFVLYVENKNQS